MAAGHRILVVDDEPEIRRFLRVSLVSHGYQLIEAPTAQEGLQQASTQHPDLVLLDLGLPDLDGVEVIRQLRQWSRVPIIVLSVRHRDDDKISAFDAGANDYVTKPFSVRELLARVGVALKHAAYGGNAGQPIFATDRLLVDLERRQVFVAGKQMHLTPTEYRILTTLIACPGRVITHRELFQEVWGPLVVCEPRYLRVYMTYLRRKIEADPARPQLILTELGIGYRFVVPD